MSPNSIISVKHNGFYVEIEVSMEEGKAIFEFTADDFARMHYEKHERLFLPSKPCKDETTVQGWKDE
jgi:hypothetical protein